MSQLYRGILVRLYNNTYKKYYKIIVGHLHGHFAYMDILHSLTYVSHYY